MRVLLAVHAFPPRSTAGVEVYTLRLAQALHHGTDHRSQICTALTTLGVEPPSIDVWEFGLQAGRSRDLPPAT